MASENEYTQNVEDNVNLPPTQNVLDLSCKNRTTSSLTKLRELMNTYSSLTSTTGDQYEQPNTSDAERERNSPYGSVLMSPYSDTNSPKRSKLIVPAALVNNNFTNNYSSNIVVPSAITPHMYRPPHLLSSNESINDIPKEMFPSSLPISFTQMSPSLPFGETARIIPQTFSPIKILQSAVALPREAEMSAAQSETVKKVTRPFKALPKDSMYFNKDDFDKYMKFKNQMMQSVKKINEHSNPKMRRTSNSPALPNSTVEEKDAAYWERRKKNNAAAKRSRDARRAKEDELAIRAAFFQNENQILKNELQYMRNILMFHNIKVDLPKPS